MLVFIRLIFIFFLFLLSFCAPFIAYINHIPSNSANVIDVEKGESIDRVLSRISNHNFINKIFIRIFIKNNNISSIQTGEYLIKDKSIKEIIISMQNGDTVTYEIRINEGINIYQLEELINNSFMINDCSYLQCLDKKYPFYEGTLFPDTYFYKKNTKSSVILSQSRTKLESFLDNLFTNEYSKSNLTKNEVLILASIIEKEAGNDSEKAIISSVFLKRLDLGIRFLKLIGVKVERYGDNINIYGNPSLELSKNFEMKNFLKDHRIFFLSCITALTLGGKWKIQDKDSINTSFPNFLKTLKSLGAKIS